MNTITLIIPEHTQAKLDELQAHYLIPPDMILQKVIVDRVDEIHELVVLEPARKKASA